MPKSIEYLERRVLINEQVLDYLGNIVAANLPAMQFPLEESGRQWTAAIENLDKLFPDNPAKQTDSQMLEHLRGTIVRMATMAADQSEAIKALMSKQLVVEQAVRAEREACAAECERMMMFEGGKQESFAHQDVVAAAAAIRQRGLP